MNNMYMYVCIYVCMYYVCMYVCVYVCMYDYVYIDMYNRHTHMHISGSWGTQRIWTENLHS